METGNDSSTHAAELDFGVDQLVKISGIKGKTAQAFIDMGICSYSELADYLRHHSAEEVSIALKERGVKRSPGLIDMEGLIRQAEELSVEENNIVLLPVEAAEPTRNSGKVLSNRENYNHDAVFTVSFDITNDEEGRPLLSTIVYDENDAGEEQSFVGNDTSLWVNWMLQRANFQPSLARDDLETKERFTREIIKESKREVRALPGWEVTIRSELGVTLQAVPEPKTPSMPMVIEQVESKETIQSSSEAKISEQEVVLQTEPEEIEQQDSVLLGPSQHEALVQSELSLKSAENKSQKETQEVLRDYPPEPYNAQIKISSVRITPVEPMLSSTEKQLEAEINFQLSGTDAHMLASNRLPYRLVIYSIGFSNGIPALVKSVDSQLEPYKYEYSHRLAFTVPAAGKYEFQNVVRLPPNGKLMDSYQGPILTIGL